MVSVISDYKELFGNKSLQQFKLDVTTEPTPLPTQEDELNLSKMGKDNYFELGLATEE